METRPKLLDSRAYTHIGNFTEKGQTKQRTAGKARLIIRLLANGKHRMQISIRDTTHKLA